MADESPPQHASQPKSVIRFLGINAALGALVGIMTASALLFLNIAGLLTLIIHSQSPVIAVTLYFAGFVLTFSNLAMGTAVMLYLRS